MLDNAQGEPVAFQPVSNDDSGSSQERKPGFPAGP